MISRLDRRRFLSTGGTLFAGAWLNGLWAAPAQPNLRMGVISDIHVGKEGDGNHRRLQRVLRYLDARRVDVIYYIATPVDTASGKAFRSRKVLARDYFMPIEHERTVPGEVAFGEGEFAPGSKIVFRMKAVNAAGQCSAEIPSEPVEIAGTE